MLFWIFVLDTPGVNTPWKKAAAEEKAAEARAAKRLEKLKPQELENTKDVEAKNAEEEEEDAEIPEEMPEDALFIPLWFARKKPKTFYKGTDPEWQSFIDFSKDRKRSQFIRSAWDLSSVVIFDELAGLIGRHMSSLKEMQSKLGMPIETRKFWLDIDFPDGPPPEYERTGLEIADDYIALTTRPVDAIEVSRLQESLWPLPVAVSLWSSYSTLWSLQLARAKGLLGIKSGEQAPGASTPKMLDFQKLTEGDEDETSQSNANFDEGEETTNSESTPPPAPPSQAMSAADISKMSTAEQRLYKLGLRGAMQDLGAALHVFQHSLIRTWKMPKVPPERGSIIISGLVELVGSKATCVIDVRAAYHPKENRWVGVGIGVRRMQAKKQSPKGGPP
ncbi:MAG: hypothetical protein Q9195_008571 [Heterodermia aff. obscurata]